MKKIFMMMGALAFMTLASCSSNDKKTEAAIQETPQEEVAAPQIDAFIANLQANDSTVMVTPTGLGYKIVKQTRGIMPSTQSTVLVKYTGKHTDGSVFDSSQDQAVEFPLEQVIPGFREGIALMPVGSTYEFYIPANLAYGQNGVPGVIEPNELLIFEVELVDIVDQ